MELILLSILGFGIVSLLMPEDIGDSELNSHEKEEMVNHKDVAVIDIGENSFEDDTPFMDVSLFYDSHQEASDVVDDNGNQNFVEAKSVEYMDNAQNALIGSVENQNLSSTQSHYKIIAYEASNAHKTFTSHSATSDDALQQGTDGDSDSVEPLNVNTGDELVELSFGAESLHQNSEIGVEFSKFQNSQNLSITISDDLPGFVHQVDVEVQYKYSAGGEGSTEESAVARNFRFYLLSSSEVLPDISLSVENIYDLRGDVDFDEYHFGNSSVIAAIDLGGTRETEFISIFDTGTPGDVEYYNIETREFVDDWAPETITLNRCITSVQDIIVDFEGRVSDF